MDELNNLYETTNKLKKITLNCLMKLDLPKSCHNCGSSLLFFGFSTKNNGGVVDGRLRMNEVGIVCFVGCDECSETLKIIKVEEIANYLTEKFYSIN